MAEAVILCGGVMDLLPTLEAESMDACLCDPPYGLSFMGKAWDHGVPGEMVWREVLRVLKPGAMLLAFGGTRTHHRLMVAIEDAGFEIRDCLMWLYGSGFPKSLDISKAIDKAAGAERKVVGIRHANYKTENGTTFGGSAPRAEHWNEDTAPATPAARSWQGYGTALKPAWEPVIVAMKPTAGTFAENALEHGVAGLNVDGSRIGTEDDLSGGTFGASRDEDGHLPQAIGSGDKGRWPANVLLDEEAAAMLDREAGVSPSTIGRGNSDRSDWFGGGKWSDANTYGDSGGPSRFFKVVDWSAESLLYRAKAIMGAWNPDLASIAGSPSDQRNRVAASVLSGAATLASRGGIRCSDWTGLSTVETESELRRLCESVIALTLSFDVERLPARLPVAPTLSSNLAKAAGENGQTAITTTIQSPPRSDGSVVAATFEATQPSADRGEADSLTRAFYTAKAGSGERNAGLEGMAKRRAGAYSDFAGDGRGRQTEHQPAANHHPTVKPISLTAYLAKLILPPEAPRHLLVPFSGSGSEIIGAMRAGWDQVTGIEIEPEYAEIAARRIRNDAPLFNTVKML